MANKKDIKKIYNSLSRKEKEKHRKWFFQYIKKYRWSVFIIFLATALLIAQGSMVPKLTQMLIDDWLPHSGNTGLANGGLRAITSIFIGLVGLAILKAFSMFLSSFVIRSFQQNIEMELKEDIYKKIMKLEVEYFDKVNEGFFIKDDEWYNDGCRVCKIYSKKHPQRCNLIYNEFCIYVYV